jgi:hypothetical protein
MNFRSHNRFVDRILRYVRLLVVALLLMPVGMTPMQVGASSSQVPPTKHWSARDAARADAKHALALELASWSNGQIPTAKFNADAAAFLAHWGPATFASQRLTMPPQSGPRGSTFTPQGLAILLDPGPPNTLSLAVTQYPEFSPAQYCHAGYTCYCGPAAAVSVLAYLNPTSHDGEVIFDVNGSWPGQFGLAGNFGSGAPYSWKYLETNAAHGPVPGGETPWLSVPGDYPMPQSFNYWVSGSYSGFPNYAPYTPTSVSDYQALLKSDIWTGGAATGFPLAGDIEEIANSLHLPGHPQNLEIQHWIAMYGYTGGGAGTDYVDPVAGSSLNWSVSAYNVGYLSSNIYTLVTDAGPNGGPYGIVW